MGDYQEIPKLWMRHRSWQNIPEENSGNDFHIVAKKITGMSNYCNHQKSSWIQKSPYPLHYSILSMYSVEFEILELAATEMLAKNPGTLNLYIIRMPRLGETA